MKNQINAKRKNQASNSSVPANPNKETYRKALKREKDRLRKRRKSAQGSFEASFMSLDRIVDSFENPSSAAVLSDGGAGVERVVAGCDGDNSPKRYRSCKRRALNRLRRKPKLRSTLKLIIKNGNRREDSIWAILESRRCPTWRAARRQYFAHLEKLLKIFCGQCLQGSDGPSAAEMGIEKTDKSQKTIA